MRIRNMIILTILEQWSFLLINPDILSRGIIVIGRDLWSLRNFMLYI